MLQSEPIHPNVFNDHLFTPACQLVKDSVPNIRMTIARCFALVLTNQLTDPQRYKITVIILRKMLSDSDRDVRDIASSCDLPDNEDDSDTSKYTHTHTHDPPQIQFPLRMCSYHGTNAHLSFSQICIV